MDRCHQCGGEMSTGGCPKCPITYQVLATQITPTIVTIPTSNSEEIFRASGDCICPTCGKEYRKHPNDEKQLSYDGFPYLKILCDGRRVKL